MTIPKRFCRLISFLLSFCLLFQSFAPVLIYAVDDATISASVETQAKPDLAPPDITPTPTVEPIPTETPSVTPSTTPIPTPTPTPDLSPTPPLDRSTGSNPEVTNVGEGVDYRYKDTNVVVRFTKITKPGKLTIREIKLTPEQIAATGALSDTAYDITSDMENGTFLYDLTLPLPQNKPSAKVEFASNADSLNQSQITSQPEEKTENTITIRGLDHFTIFFVTSGEDRATDGTWCDDPDATCTFGEEESLKTVDGDYLDISSVTGIPGWSASYFDSQYVQFNFNHPELTGVSIANAKLKLVYKTNSVDGEYDSDAKLVISDDGNFDNPEGYEVISVKPTAATITDQSFLVQLPSQYQDSTKLTNLKIRFYLYGVADDGFVTTSFNQAVLLVNYSPPTSTFNTIDSPTNNNSPTITGKATSNGGATIKAVKYRADTGLWKLTTASDGFFDSASELFNFSLSALTDGDHVFETSVTDSLDTIQTETASLNLAVDTTAPAITVPADITAEASSSLGATVTYTSPTATDTQDGSEAVSCDKNSGDTFPLGLTIVHCSSTDTAGNIANKTFKVTIQDTTLPVITLNGVVSDIEINHAYTELGATAIDAVDVSFAATPTGSVDTATVGSYIITYNAVDTHGNHATAVTRTVNVVDSIAKAFAIISANLAAPGSDIANNLNLVNTNNVGGFSNLYFKKSIDGTPVGKLTFTKALNLSDSATQTFLQNLGSKLDQGNGRIALNATESGIFVSTGASLEMYDIMASVTSSNLVVRDDSGTALDPLGIISGFTYDSEANKVIFDTAHFTQFDIDTTAPTKPTATPAAGDYTSDQSVTLESSDSLSGLDKIYYTTDGSTPDKTKTEYTGMVTVDRDMTIKAIAYDKAGNASDILEAVYGIAPKISAETSSSSTTTSATITWTTDDPATSRVIFDTVSHSGLGEAPNYGYINSTVEDSTKVTSHAVGLTGLTAGTTYYYRTVSRGSPEAVSDERSFTTSSEGVGGSGVSDGKSGTPSAPVCNNTEPGSAPTLLSAFGGVNNVTLKWTEAADPLTYYLITYGTKPGAQTYGNPNIGGKGTTGYTVSGLSGGITYYFQVRAGNGCAPGDFSNEITATTQGAAIATETPAEGFAPDVKGASTELTPTPTSAVLGETKNNQFSWWLIFLLLATGGFGAWIFFRRR